MAPRRYAIEIWGDVKLNNLWISHAKAVVSEDPVVVMTNGDWWELYTGNEARRIINEINEIIKTPEGVRPRVAWRVTEIP